MISVTLIIIIITAITSYRAWSKPDIFEKWLFNPYIINHQKQYYRFLSSGFIHRDNMHLIFNMITLYFFGSRIEQIYQHYYSSTGIVFYLITYLFGIVVADMLSYIKHRNNPHYSSIGASGGVSAVLFASIIYDPTSSICLYFAICIPGFILGGLYLIYSYYQGRRAGSNINHDAHLVGSVFGILITLLIRPAVAMQFIEQIMNYELF